MKHIIERVREYMKRKAVRARFRKAVSVLCCLVVFVTTYALVLPSLALEKEATCGMEEHEHTADCYTRELSCGQEESEEHQHTDECYEDVLRCGKEVHIHTKDCFPQEEPKEKAEEKPAAEEKQQEGAKEPAQKESAKEEANDAGKAQDSGDDKDGDSGSGTKSGNGSRKADTDNKPSAADEAEYVEKTETDSADIAEPENPDTIDFAKILTGDTDIYYLPEYVDRDDKNAVKKG